MLLIPDIAAFDEFMYDMCVWSAFMGNVFSRWTRYFTDIYS